MVTHKAMNVLKSDFVLKRVCVIDMTHRKLLLKKSIKSKPKETFDLNKLSWVDANITDEFVTGYRHIFQSVNIDVSFRSHFTAVHTFIYPMAIGLQNGEMHLIWFESEEKRA